MPMVTQNGIAGQVFLQKKTWEYTAFSGWKIGEKQSCMIVLIDGAQCNA